MGNIDPDILATLTDEERAAIEEGMSDSEKEALAALAEEGDDDEDDDDDDVSEGAAPVEGKGAADGDDGGKSDDSDDAGPAVNDESGKGAEADDGDDVAEEGYKPRYLSQLPADYDEQVKAVQDEAKALAQQFKDGDIDFDELEAKRSELDTRRDELRALKVKADIATEMNAQAKQQEWEITVRTFAKQAAKTDGIHYATDEAKRGKFDFFLKALGSDPENANKDMQWFVEEAHRCVKSFYGLGKQEAPANNKPEKPNRKPPIESAPKTLAQVPGGEGPGDVGDEFADLDSLDGIDLERAIAKMTPAQREKYAMGA